MAQLIMQEEGSTPSTPASNKWSTFYKSDGLYILDDAGNTFGPFNDFKTTVFTTGGTSTAYTITTIGAPALATNESFRVKFNATAGATPTLNRDGKGAKSLKYYNAAGVKTACSAATIIANMICDVVYDGTDYVVLSIPVRTNHTELTSIGTNTHAQIDTYLSNLILGWVADANTWSYSSADSPTFVISINADMTAILQAGMRIKLTQTTAKYFIITNVGSFSAGATLVTVYGGTDYTLANAAISSPYYSNGKSPFGFPLDPSKWTVTVISDSSNQSQATPTVSTWYNVGSLSGSVPIGVWKMSVKARVDASHAGATSLGIRSTLSTANNSESNTESTTNSAFGGSGLTNIGNFVSHRFTLVLTSKTTHYLNLLTGTASCTAINTRGDLSQTIVKAECAYL
jgi:hypothetical protein